MNIATVRARIVGEKAAFRRLVGSRIARARKRLGWRQPALAQAAGCPSYMISRYETGQVLPRTLTLMRLAAALGVTMDYLLAADEPDQRREGR